MPINRVSVEARQCPHNETGHIAGTFLGRLSWTPLLCGQWPRSIWTRRRRSSSWRNYCKSSTYRCDVTVTACPIGSSKKYGQKTPNALIPHHTVTFAPCRGFWYNMRGLFGAQYLQFCLFTYPFKWKYASSDMITWLRNCGVSSIILKMFMQNSMRTSRTRGRISCTIRILNWWNFNSSSVEQF